MEAQGDAGCPSRMELEDEWRLRLEEAHTNYRLAELERRRAEEECEARGAQLPSHITALWQAESDARIRWMETLKIFTDLVLAGKTPGSKCGRVSRGCP